MLDLNDPFKAMKLSEIPDIPVGDNGQRRKLSIFFAFFAYGGNGGTASEAPTVREWTIDTLMKCKRDERVGDIHHKTFSDTPIPMTRNQAVAKAQAVKSDVLVMIDSDMAPDCMIGRDSSAKPFWDTAFDFLWKRHPSGPVVVAAPYCGPPPIECVYIMEWRSFESDNPNPQFKMEMISRESAAIHGGIGEVAAMGTGLIMYDMRVFDLVNPPYFYYEWKDDSETEKASTEDIACTRDLSLAGIDKLGYNPIYAAWDSWAGHWKPKCVVKPQLIYAKEVGYKLRGAYDRGINAEDKLIEVGVEEAPIVCP